MKIFKRITAIITAMAMVVSLSVTVMMDSLTASASERFTIVTLSPASIVFLDTVDGTIITLTHNGAGGSNIRLNWEVRNAAGVFIDGRSGITITHNGTNTLDMGDYSITFSMSGNGFVTVRETAVADCNHILSESTTAPTCIAQGETKVICTRDNCDYSATTVIDALGHSFGEWYEVTPATCGNNGSEQRDCIRCDEYETRAIDALDCDFGDWYVYKAAECGKEGESRRNCENCNNFETASIDALDCLPGAPATCTTSQNCTVCGFELAPALGHTPGAEATCIDPQLCTVCDVELNPALGHDYIGTVTDPTCIDDGFTTYICSVCDDEYVDDEIDALGHLGCCVCERCDSDIADCCDDANWCGCELCEPAGGGEVTPPGGGEVTPPGGGVTPPGPAPAPGPVAPPIDIPDASVPLNALRFEEEEENSDDDDDDDGFEIPDNDVPRGSLSFDDDDEAVDGVFDIPDASVPLSDNPVMGTPGALALIAAAAAGMIGTGAASKRKKGLRFKIK